MARLPAGTTVFIKGQKCTVREDPLVEVDAQDLQETATLLRLGIIETGTIERFEGQEWQTVRHTFEIGTPAGLRFTPLKSLSNYIAPPEENAPKVQEGRLGAWRPGSEARRRFRLGTACAQVGGRFENRHPRAARRKSAVVVVDKDIVRLSEEWTDPGWPWRLARPRKWLHAEIRHKHLYSKDCFAMPATQAGGAHKLVKMLMEESVARASV
ncbi:unnamed protein product [Symbiodinium microadriaticum]|nr:unnamed protein product [Symbiodinium microadriaticum]